MKKNIINVLLSFCLVALTAYGASALYADVSRKELLLAREVESVQKVSDEKLAVIIATREEKLAAEAFAQKMEEVRLQAKKESAAKAKEEAMIAATKEGADRAAASKEAAARSEAQHQADLVAAQAAEIAKQKAVESEKIAAQKAAGLAAAGAAAKKSSRRSRAS